MREALYSCKTQLLSVFKEHHVTTRERGSHLVAVVFRLGKGKRGLVPQALNIQSRTRTQVRNPLGNLRWAARLVGTPQVHIAFFLRSERSPTRRTHLRHHEGILAPITCGNNRSDDLRDHIAGFAQDDKVTNENALAFDFACIVQGRPRNVRPRDENPLHDAVRGDASGASDLDSDIKEARVDFFGREFIGSRPPRSTRGRPQGGLNSAIVNFDDNAINFVFKRVTLRSQLSDSLLDRGASAQKFGVGGNRHSPFLQAGEPSGKSVGRFERRISDLDSSDPVGKHGKGAFGRLSRVFLTQGTSSSVTGVDEGRLAGAHAFLIEGFKILCREIDLSANFHALRNEAAEAVRDRRNRQDVRGHVLANPSVSTSRGTHEDAIFIEQVHC